MTELLFGIIAIILSLFGWEKLKNKKQKKTIAKQQQVIDQGKIQHEIDQTAIHSTGEVVQQTQVVEEQKQEYEQALEEAKTDEEVIQVHNSFIDHFNRSSRN